MKNYLEKFYEEFDYPEDARRALSEGYGKICESEQASAIFGKIIKAYEETHKLSAKDMKDDLGVVSAVTGVHDYTVKLLIHICLSKELRAFYAASGVDDGLWYAAMSDLKWKLMESHLVKGVWGTFVADGNWFSRWYDMTRFAFCRLQFEIIQFNKEYEKDGLKLDRQSKAVNVHIPRTGTPLDHDEVLKSYAMAAEFFKDEFEGGPVVFTCSSWLLFREHENILHERSNIRKFMSDYDIFISDYYPETNRSAVWRIFDCSEETPIDEMPETSFIMRAYKDYIKNGGKLGYGVGVFAT